MNPNEVPDSMGANLWISLGSLLDADERLTEYLGVEDVTAALIATAIEKEGIYHFDRFGRYMFANGDDKAQALDLVAYHYDWCRAPESDGRNDPRSPVEQSADSYPDPYGRLGWATDVLPNFKEIQQTLVESPVVRSVRDKKRKAPDAFVSALIRLLVEIAKKDPTLNVDKMPGIKTDFLELASKFDEKLDFPISTFDTYIESLCKFNRGARTTTYYQKLFHEFFKDVPK